MEIGKPLAFERFFKQPNVIHCLPTKYCFVERTVAGEPSIYLSRTRTEINTFSSQQINGNLQKNYNSVDFVEVEQVDDGKGPRELGAKIKQLRENLVNGIDGSMPKVEVLYHYDNMR